jgi:hypothetical protein
MCATAHDGPTLYKSMVSRALFSSVMYEKSKLASKFNRIRDSETCQKLRLIFHTLALFGNSNRTGLCKSQNFFLKINLNILTFLYHINHFSNK